MSTQLNLMTTQARNRATMRAGIRFWMKVYLTAATMMLFAWGLSWWDCNLAARKLAQLEDYYEPIKQLRVSTKAKEDQIVTLRNEERVALSLAVKRPAMSLVGMVSNSAAESDGNVYLQHFDLRQEALTSDGQVGSSVVQLRGIGRDDNAVAKFVEHLRRSDMFFTVELKSTVAKRQRESVVREFHVECTL